MKARLVVGGWINDILSYPQVQDNIYVWGVVTGIYNSLCVWAAY